MADVLRRYDDASTEIRTPLAEHSIGDLRACASRWHGGQWSPFYAFASTGSVVAGLAGEAESCRRDLAKQGDDAEYDHDGLEDDRLRAIASLEPEPTDD